MTQKSIFQAVVEYGVRFANRFGGPEAAVHERAALEAFASGHMVENLSEARKADAAALEHIFGHNPRPLDTPSASTATPNANRGK